MRPRTILVACVAALSVCALAGCGSDNSTDEKTPSATVQEPTQTTAPKPEPTPETKATPAVSKADYRAAVADCAEGLGYKTRDAGNALRIESPAGHMKANVQTFGSAKAARNFYGQLEVDGAQGDKGVAIWLADAGDSDRAVIQDCLTP